MLHVQNEDIDSPIVDYTTGLATVYCDDCNMSKVSFPLKLAAQFIGGNAFTLSSNTFGCSCNNYITIYSLRGIEPMAQILTQLYGF